MDTDEVGLAAELPLRWAGWWVEDAMPNQVFRSRLIGSIQNARREAKDAAALGHAGLTGRIRELCAERIFRPMLPQAFLIGTGKITDRDGKLSAETDLVIHDPSLLPPIMHSERDGVFAVDACHYAIEVKSTLDAGEIRTSLAKGQQLATLHDDHTVPGTSSLGTCLVLFAFDSDLVSTSSELERYAKYDPKWATDPLFKVICVVGRGYWFYSRSERKWYCHPATKDHDEVIDLVAGIANTLASVRHDRRAPPLGRYLMAMRKVSATKFTDV